MKDWIEPSTEHKQSKSVVPEVFIKVSFSYYRSFVRKGAKATRPTINMPYDPHLKRCHCPVLLCLYVL